MDSSLTLGKKTNEAFPCLKLHGNRAIDELVTALSYYGSVALFSLDVIDISATIILIYDYDNAIFY